MSHTDFITPFSVEETLDWPHDKLPEPRIEAEKFTDLLLKRWPHTGKPTKKHLATGVYHYVYAFRTKADEHPNTLGN
jgi:hypothetical protein